MKGGDRMPLREIIAVMRRVYCGKIGTEYRHISSPDREVLDPRAHRRRGLRRPAPESRAQEPSRQADRGRGVRALPRHEVPRPAALLRRGRATRRSRCSTGSSRARRARGVDEVVDRHVPPRPAEHPRQRRRQLRRAHLQRLRGRRAPGLSGRRGRREVPPGRAHDAPVRVGPRRRDPGRVEPVAPRGGRPGRRGRRAGQAGAHGRPWARRPGSARCRCCSTATRRSPGRAWSRRS